MGLKVGERLRNGLYKKGGAIVLKEAEIRQFIMDDENSERKKLARLGQKYYEGDHDIKDYRMFYYNAEGDFVEDTARSNIKIPHPFFTELVDQAVQYILSGTDEYIKSDNPDLQIELKTYFGEDFAKNFKEGLTRKMHSHDGICDTTTNDSVRNYAAYMNAFQPSGLLDTIITTPNGDKMSYLQWISDSTFNANTNSWNKFFKKNDTIWSKVKFDTLGFRIDTTFTVSGRPPKRDTTWFYDTVPVLKPWIDTVNYVYPQIVRLVDSIWDNKVTFYDLIKSADGYSIEYKREYYINAEFRVYDKKGFDPAKHEEGAYTEGTYSSTDAKEIAIN